MVTQEERKIASNMIELSVFYGSGVAPCGVTIRRRWPGYRMNNVLTIDASRGDG